MVEHLTVTPSSALPLFILGALVVGSFVVFGIWRDNQRRQQLIAYCRSQGWTYEQTDPSLVTRWSGTPFNRGENRRAVDVVRGVRDGRPFTAFSYSYVERRSDSKGGTQTTTYRFGVVALGLPSFLPTLEVLPDTVFSRAAAAVGFSSGIELESEDFNRKFRVTSKVPKFASDVLTPRTMELLLRSPVRPWRIEGTDLVAWDTGQLNPVEILAALAPLTAVVAGIPTFVWHDHGYDPQGASAPPTPPAAPTEGTTP